MLGIGVFDALTSDIVDNTTGELYPALSCCNDKIMAERCKVDNAPKVIWSIKANATFNNDISLLLRNGFQQGKINLLVNENECDDIFNDKIKGYDKMIPFEKTFYKLPYIQTTLLIHELIRLGYEVKGTNVKIIEKSGERKDRYSSLAYNYWVMYQLEMDLLKGLNKTTSIDDYANKLKKLNKRPKLY